MSQKRILSDCGHCGNKLPLDVLTSYQHSDYDPEDGFIPEHYTIQLLRCPTCSQPTLRQVYWNIGEHYDGHRELEGDEEILYPKTGLSNSIGTPTSVQSALSAALKVRAIEPNACAVLIRRTLEVICNEEKCTKRTLVENLKELGSNGRIPPPLAQMADHLRKLGNIGAHAGEDQISPGDIPFMIEFAQAIIEYLYIAPAKIALAEKRLRKDTAK